MVASPVEKRPRGSTAAWLLSAAAALLIVTAVIAAVLIQPTFALTRPAALPAGTTLYSLDLSGTTPAEAIALVEQFAAAAAADTVRLTSDKREITVTRAELGWTLQTDRLLAMLHEHARGQGSGFRTGELAPLTRIVIDPQQLTAVLDEHFGPDGDAPVPADWHIDGDHVRIIPAQPGTRPSPAGLALAMFQNPLADAYTVPFVPAWPEVTETTLRATGLDGLRGSYTTYYYVTDQGRARNVELAAEAIDGTWLMPGEELSFNAATAAVPDEAWQPATVIVNNEFVPGIGGGICQVSSTLYAAALVADVEIVSRTNHSLPVFYMDPGFDATVASGGPDLVIRNQTDAPLVITAEAADGTLTVRMFGKTVPGQQITLHNKIVSEHGPIAELYRTVWQDGVAVRTERVNRSVYYSP